MKLTIFASGRAQTATAAVIGVGYLAIALLQGGYATTSIAWGAVAIWIAVAVAAVFRLWGAPTVSRLGVVAIGCFAGLATLSAVSAAWADDAARAWSAALLPALYAGFLALLLLCREVIRPRSWLVGLAVGTTLTAAIALASRLFPGIVSDQGALTAIGAQGRLSYPIGYWNGLAACLAAGLVLLVWLSTEASRRTHRAVATGLLPVGGLALFFTSSRGGVVAAALGLGVLVALARRRWSLVFGMALGTAATVALALVASGNYALIHDLGSGSQRTAGVEIGAMTVGVGAAIGWIRWRFDGWLEALTVPRNAARIGLGALALAAAAVVIAAGPGTLAGDLSHDTPTPTTASGPRNLFVAGTSGRTQFWGAALAAFASRPVGGVGAGNYELYWNAHPRERSPAGNAHSLFLEELADLGLLGLALAIGPFAAAVVAIRRLKADLPPEALAAIGLLVAASVGAAIDWTWKIPSAFIPVLVAIGLLIGMSPAARSQSVRSTTREASEGSRFGVGVLTVVFAWAVIWVGGIVLYASWRLAESRAAVGRGDLATAVDDAQSAASVEPFSPEPQIQLALVYARAGDLRRAREAALKAAENAPGDWRGWKIASELDAHTKHKLRAFDEFAKADALTPGPAPKIPLGLPDGGR